MVSDAHYRPLDKFLPSSSFILRSNWKSGEQEKARADLRTALGLSKDVPTSEVDKLLPGAPIRLYTYSQLSAHLLNPEYGAVEGLSLFILDALEINQDIFRRAGRCTSYF